MIKDSKLIGTKIAAPLGWKKFKVGELFDVKLSKSDNKINELSVGSIPLVSSGIENSGVVGYVSSDLLGLSPFKDSIVADMFGNWTVHEGDFYAVSHGRVNILEPNFLFSSFACLFICSVGMKHTFDLYGFDNMLSSTKIKSIELDLPITSDGKPDFEWMSDYIKVVKTDYLERKELSNQREIKDYLTAGNTDSMDVTDADRQFLRDFEKLPRRKFKLCELFVPVNPKRYDLKISDIIDNNGNTIVISSTTVNQGIKGYSSMKPLVKANKIVYSDAVGPSMMFYQERDFIADAHVKYLKPRFTVNMSKNMALYLITCIQKSTFGVYSYGNKYNNDAVNNTMVELPVIDSSQVDVDSIEKYMQIQSKPLINKVSETLVPVGGKCHS